MEEPPTKIGRGLHGVRGLKTKKKRGNDKKHRFSVFIFHGFFPNVSNVSKFVTPSGAICLPRGAVVGCGVGSRVPGKQMDRP